MLLLFLLLSISFVSRFFNLQYLNTLTEVATLTCSHLNTENVNWPLASLPAHCRWFPNFMQISPRFLTFKVSPHQSLPVLSLCPKVHSCLCYVSSSLIFCSCVFQSGRSPSSSERTMPAHVSTGRVCGQELHPVQDQTSLKENGGSAWPGLARPCSAQLCPTTQSSLHCSRFLSDNKHFNDNFHLPRAPPK